MRRLMHTLSERNQPPVVPAALMEDDARESLERENHALRAQLQASTTRLQSVETEKTLLSTDNGRLRHELQTASKTIEDSKRLLETLEEDYKKFVSTVLDQINSPIHVIDGSTAFLSRDLSTLREALEHASLQSTSPNALPNLNAFSETIAQMKEHLNRLQESTQQQTEATRDMLIAFSRKTSSNMDTDSSSTPHTSPTEHAHMTPPSTPPLPRKLRILAVDDQESILKITRKQLANTHTLETAINGEAAVAEWQKALDSHTPFDVIIMDVCMPGMGGLKATETIRQRELEQGIQPVLIIGLSGNTQAQDIATGLASGMNIYLTKPCNRETLLKAIANKPLSNTETTSNSSPEMIGHANLSTADGFSIQQHDRRDTHP